MSKKNNKGINDNSQLLLFKKYRLVSNIGGGSFGTVFQGINVWTKEDVAIKIEERKKSRTTLEREAFILYYLKGPGLPDVISFGKTKKYNILIQTLLGRSLYEIYNNCDKKFSIKDVCMIGIQILERLEYIHSKNYIHRDIKPHNFLVNQKNEGLIYIIDFGLAKKYRSDRGNHVKFSITKHIAGTPRFCSINAMRGVEQSRKDDLESLSYLILYFLRGSLPWQGLKITSKSKRFKTITNIKKSAKLEELCENFPPEILLFCKYTRKLGFEENPKYEYMKNLFNSILNKYGTKNDNKFSWIENDAFNSNDKISNFRLHKNSPHKRLINKIRTSLEKKRKEKNKEKDNNKNDYTLSTIFIENQNKGMNLREMSHSHNNIIQNAIQSNDNNILQKNLQLNIDNYKYSYNNPIVIGNKYIISNTDNNFSRIAQIFRSNDSNILGQNSINIPDKISMIEATQSNLSNLQISNNPILLISEKSKKNAIKQNKGIKLHDFIRQEEKEGGVIGKDFDFKKNDYFQINTPFYNSTLGDTPEREMNNNNNKINFGTNNEINQNKSIENNNYNKFKNTIIQNRVNNYFNINLNNNKKFKFINGNKKNSYYKLNNLHKKMKNSPTNSYTSIQNNNSFSNKEKKIKSNYSQNNSPKLDSFYIKKATINLENKQKRILSKHFNKEINDMYQKKDPKIRNSYNSKIKTAINGKKYLTSNGKTLIISGNNNSKDNFNNFHNDIINKNNNNLKINLTNFTKFKAESNRMNENRNQNIISNYKNINNILKKKSNKKRFHLNTESLINYSTNNIYNNKIVNNTERNLNQNSSIIGFKTRNNLRIFKELNNNKNNSNKSYINKINKEAKGYNNLNNLSHNNIYNSYNKEINNNINLNSANKLNNNHNKIMHVNSFNNEINKNIIINNVIIKNQFNI